MYLAKVNFGRNRFRQDRWDIENTAESFLVALIRNGQLCGDYTFGWVRGSLNAYVYLSRPNAFDKRFSSEWGKESLAKVSEAFGRSPRCTVLEDQAPKRFPNWRNAPALFLQTAWSIHESPVQRIDDNKPIPTFLLPLSDRQKDDIYCWASSYRDHDRIWTRSGELEIPAYKQIAEPESELSLWGRDICTVIEKTTGIPTYYYLYRYWGRKGEEDTRRCPNCGKKWRVKGSSEFTGSHWHLIFQCKKCRLISHEACTDDDARHAGIGEYKRRK